MTASSDVTHPIDRAQRLLTSDPLLAADLSLVALGNTRGHRSPPETEHYLEILSQAVMAASSCAVVAESNVVEAMLAEGKCDHLACAALLRLLVLDEGVFTEDTRLLGTIALFDRVAGGRLYKAANIVGKTQAFEKRAALRNIVASHETALQNHIDSLGSLDALAAFRQQLSKLFKDQVTQLAVQPFLPGITIQTLNEVLAAVQAVANADEATALDASDAALGRCNALSTSAASLGTVYARTLLGGLSATLSALVRADVRRRGLADPASVRVEAVEKRYPFTHVGAGLVIRLDVINDGPGQAQELAIAVEGDDAVALEEPGRDLGPFPPGTRRIDFRGRVARVSSGEMLLVRLTWLDPDGSQREEEQLHELPAQAGDVPWDSLEYEDPYPLEAVTESERFVGRQAVLHELTRIVLGGTPGNARIVGQKRVGKTSIAYALAANVECVRPGAYKFVFVQSGDFNANTPDETVKRLGEVLVAGVRATDPRLAGLKEPDFTGGLAPLTELFADVAVLVPELRFVLVLDEFDAMPHPELYEHGAVAGALFQTLRSLGSKPNLGFVLIGGERMRFVIASHGQALNRFRLVTVDYFDDEHYSDYCALVRDPVSGWLEFDDAAVRLLHTETAGNPWITKSVAGELFDRHRVARDSDVRLDDARHAIDLAIPRLGATSFQHFWDDAIQGGLEDQAQVSLLRRKVLLGIAFCLREGTDLTDDSIARAARRFDMDGATAVDVLGGFRERGILLADAEGTLRFRVPVFGRWLVDEGVGEIVVTMGDDDAIIRRQRAQEALRPKAEELEELDTRWRTYAGQLITAERIRRWLGQFGGPGDQRLMLKLLQGLRYYRPDDVRERLRRLQQFVLRDLASAGYEYRLEGRLGYRRDLLVCALESGGSGATHLLKPFRDENRIYAECVVDADAVPKRLTRDDEVRAVLVLEDFIGTGTTAQRGLDRLTEGWTAGGAWPQDVPVYLLAVCGFESAVERVRTHATKLSLSVAVEVADLLGETDRAFSPESSLFAETADRERAKAIAIDRGGQLEPKTPLGYRDSQALVCFESRCPNNTLPILRKDGPTWDALFPRH
jgi:hypothetical protein